MRKFLPSIRTYFNKFRRRALIAASVALIIQVILWGWADIIFEKKLLFGQRLQVSAEIAPYGNALATAINRQFALLDGMSAFVKHEINSPDGLNSGEFEIFAAGLYTNAKAVRNLTLSPDGINKHVYPLEGNQNVLGHDLINDERANVRADIQRTIQTRQIAISGPYELRQGGLGI